VALRRCRWPAVVAAWDPLPGDGKDLHVEELGIRYRAAEDLLHHLRRIRTLYLVAIRLTYDRTLLLGGALRNPAGSDVTDAVAAYLAGVSQEAARTAKLLGLGVWTGLSAEGKHGNVHVSQPSKDALLLVVRDRGVPLGRLAILAQRATGMAKRWLDKQ